MAKQKQRPHRARATAATVADVVGIQVPIGRIRTGRHRWQTIFDGRDKSQIYRIYNGSAGAFAAMESRLIVEVDGAHRRIDIDVGTSVDVLGKKIRVKAGAGAGDSHIAQGWYVLIS